MQWNFIRHERWIGSVYNGCAIRKEGYGFY
ncbi:hypothetical protein KP509_36G036100 [Ceratopteris richardii]|uniref:Uncharacterized protein n=1 Tax=Ceratopteris richardii TaxID=49495 RepID=A0A8T2QDF8_CERRI|nr:hypothetical protein KP509_36G036100 [Ceratopteris richardii]